LILCYFNRLKLVILEANAFNKALREIVSQLNNNRVLYLYAFYSRKFNSAEYNYKIYDKEILAIVEYIDL
jgi:RNase H-like domain found in reverse transcriptase